MSREDRPLPRIGAVRAAVALAVLAALIGLETLIHKHPYFEQAGRFGFYALAGLGSGIAAVVLGWLVRLALGRREGFYDD